MGYARDHWRIQNFRTGEQIFAEIFLRLFTGVSENLFAFSPKNVHLFIYSPKISDDRRRPPLDP